MDLKFDAEMPVNTNKAQAYLGLSLEDHYDEFGDPYYEKEENAYKLHHNYSAVLKENIEFDGTKFVKKSQDIKVVQLYLTEKAFSDLAMLLKGNFSLITQLEYLIRNIPVEDTAAQLRLIIKHLKCYKPMKFISRLNSSCDGSMYPDDFLLTLGGFVYTPYKFKITAFKNTAVITHLFVKLCHQAGLNSMTLIFSDGPKFPESPFTNEAKTWLKSGTVAVVSESADVDSAVHTFLMSSKQTPWRLRKILVQESVYNEFKDALRWKCNLKKQESEKPSSCLPSSESLVYDHRTFVIDPVDCSATVASNMAVFIEAYRTNKEIISILLKQNVRYLSLWSNCIAEINELTHSAKSPIVWVNSLAEFRGPPQVAKAFYYDGFDRDYTHMNLRHGCISQLCEVRQSWTKLDIESRREILTKVLEKHVTCDQAVKDKIIDALNDCEMQSIVDVGKDYVCLVTSGPIGGIVRMRPDEHFVTEEIFKSLLKGNGYLLCNDIHEDFAPTIDCSKFMQAGVPVMYAQQLPIDDKDRETDTYVRLYTRCHGTTRYRAIWTNSGTIFAN